MKTLGLRSPGGARARVLLVLIAAALISLVPALHHHAAPGRPSPAGQADRSCALCAANSGMDVADSGPSLEAPPREASAPRPTTRFLLADAPALAVDGRAPPLLEA